MRERRDNLIAILALASMIMGVAIWNGFPLVYADTGTYLVSAMDGVVPEDRPYWYGVYLRWTVLGYPWPWLPVTLQALLCALLILRLFRLHAPRTRVRLTAMVCTTILMLGTGLGWNAGQLMPDIFTGIGVLSLLLLWSDTGVLWRTIAYSILVITSTWVHSSNLIIITLLVMAFLPAFGSGRPTLRQGWRGVMLTTVMAWLGLLQANRMADGEAYVAKGGHVFLMGRMVDSGMLPAWLDAHCPKEQLALCAYRDHLPANSQLFLWDADSPLQHMGGWEATRQEYGHIVRSSFMEPRFLWWHIRDGLRSTFVQLHLWTVGERLRGTWYREADSPPYQAIAQYLPDALPAYRSSRQCELPDGGEAVLQAADHGYQFTMVATALLMLVALLPGVLRRLGLEKRVLLSMTISAVLIDCAVCAGSSIADDRFLSRISWILPLAAMLCIADLAWLRSTQNTGQAVSV